MQAQICTPGKLDPEVAGFLNMIPSNNRTLDDLRKITDFRQFKNAGPPATPYPLTDVERIKITEDSKPILIFNPTQTKGLLIGTWFASRIINSLKKKVRKNENKDGFIANIITDKKEIFGLGYGIDIIECGICKLFNKHNLDKYAPILCEVDKITSHLAGLTLIRTGSIANGAEK